MTAPPTSTASPAAATGCVGAVRLQLSRAKGFDLQAHSLAVNGLEAVNVARPGRFGNPFSIADAADIFDCRTESAHAHAVEWFREWITTPLTAEAHQPMHVWDGYQRQHARITAGLPELRGKNLACFCKPGFACHADVLLMLANPIVCEPIDATRSTESERSGVDRG